MEENGSVRSRNRLDKEPQEPSGEAEPEPFRVEKDIVGITIGDDEPAGANCGSNEPPVAELEIQPMVGEKHETFYRIPRLLPSRVVRIVAGDGIVGQVSLDGFPVEEEVALVAASSNEFRNQ